MAVYPACAGIDLRKDVARRLFKGLPRMRGDRPSCRKRLTFPLEFTPHARGSTLLQTSINKAFPVYPACAGIDLLQLLPRIRLLRLPRMRGDRPSCYNGTKQEHRFTPHARGSTLGYYSSFWINTVYPACAGIDPPSKIVASDSSSLPRMRGDRPSERRSATTV